MSTTEVAGVKIIGIAIAVVIGFFVIWMLVVSFSSTIANKAAIEAVSNRVKALEGQRETDRALNRIVPSDH
jgi:hypothetical protein